MLDRKRYMVRERVRLARLTDKFDIFDPDTGEEIGYAQEEPGAGLALLRLFMSKKVLPNRINVYSTEGGGEPRLVLTVTKPFTFFRSYFTVSTPDGRALGTLRSKIFTIGGGLVVISPSGEEVADLSGNFIGWEFTLTDNSGREIGRITKKWAGALKEMFTTADNYLVEAYDDAPPGANVLLLCSALAIDAVYKEANK